MGISDPHHMRLMRMRQLMLPVQVQANVLKAGHKSLCVRPSTWSHLSWDDHQTSQCLRPHSLRIKKSSHPLHYDKLCWGKFCSSRLCVKEKKKNRKRSLVPPAHLVQTGWETLRSLKHAAGPYC